MSLNSIEESRVRKQVQAEFMKTKPKKEKPEELPTETNEAFEEWYCNNYWNFKGVYNRQVFFRYGKYNHMDVDLAWNSWQAATKHTARACADIAIEYSDSFGGVTADEIVERYELGANVCG